MEGFADLAFALRITRLFGVCGVRKQAQNALVAEARKPCKINYTAVYGVCVYFKVARLNDNARVGFDCKRHSARDRVIDVYKFNSEIAQFRFVAGIYNVNFNLVVELVL